jgi:hypothetical protein
MHQTQKRNHQDLDRRPSWILLKTLHVSRAFSKRIGQPVAPIEGILEITHHS